MTLDDVEFSRVIIGSVVAFGVLALAYFRLFGHRAKVAVATGLSIILPGAGVASVGAAIAFDPPLVAKVLLWLLAASIAFMYLFGLIANRSLRSALKTRPKT